MSIDSSTHSLPDASEAIGAAPAPRGEAQKAPGRESAGGDSSSPGLREMAIASAALALLAALAFLPHIWHGGLYSDDWADAAATFYPPAGPGFGHALSNFADILSYCRPLLIFLLPLKYVVFGTHIKFLLALAVGLAALVAIFGYAVLRTLGVPWYHAGLIAALTIAYPWFDSTRFWESASPTSLAIALALAGLWVALVGLSRSSWRLHLFAAVLYLASILTYEITLPLIAAAGVLYTFRVGWRRAWPRWGVDLAVVIAGGLWDRTHTPRAVSTLSGDIDHLREIVTNGGTLLGRTVLSLGPQPHTTTTLIVLGAVFAGGLIAYLAVPRLRAKRSEWGLRGWLLLALGGLAVAMLGWATFIPADPYYTPSVFGETNRVNGLAGIGLVMAVYAAFGMIGTLIGELTKKGGLAVAATLALGLALGATYLHVLERHGRLWDAAFRAEMVAADRMQAELPKLPHGTTVFISNYPANQTLGVPIFSSVWGLDGLVKVRYDDGSLRAYPVTSELELICGAAGVGVGASGEMVAAAAPYDTARLLDLSTGRHSTPSTRQQCLAERDSYPPGPLYLQLAY